MNIGNLKRYVQGEAMDYGTSEGVRKSWLKRERARKGDEADEGVSASSGSGSPGGREAVRAAQKRMKEAFEGRRSFAECDEAAAEYKKALDNTRWSDYGKDADERMENFLKDGDGYATWMQYNVEHDPVEEVSSEEVEANYGSRVPRIEDFPCDEILEDNYSDGDASVGETVQSAMEDLNGRCESVIAEYHDAQEALEADIDERRTAAQEYLYNAPFTGGTMYGT